MKCLLLLLILAFPALAARTTVTDTLTRADGSFCTGTISISNPPFTSIDGPVAGGTFTIPINASGTFTVSLEPGPYYTATYVTAPAGCTPTVEFWSVPVSATPVDLASVRSVSPPPPLPNTLPLSGLQQSGATTGQCVSWNGTNWAASSTCGSGLSTLTIGTTTITSGTTTRVLFDNAGVLGEYTISGTGSVCMTVSCSMTTPALGTPSAVVLTNATGLPVSGITGLGTGVATALQTNVSGSGAICLVTGSSCSGSGTVTVVGAGSLTSTALVTGGGSQTIQTPSATATMDASGNIATPGSLSIGVGSGQSGTIELTQGTAPSLGTTSVKIYAPTSVTSYGVVLPGAADTGILYGQNVAGVVTLIFAPTTGAGNVVLSTSPTLVNPALGTPSAIVLTNGTGLPVGGLTGLGTGVATALGIAVSGSGAICLASGSACSGGATNITVGSSTITSGTDTRILYDNMGVLGEYTLTGTGTVVVMATSPTLVTPALGTPASGVMTNVTGTASGLTSGITLALKSATTTVDVSAATAPTSGQVLTATAGTTATWQTPSGGSGGLTLVEQHTASASASLDFTTCISSTYDDYQIELINLIPATDLAGLIFRVSTDGGSTYDSGTNYQNDGFGWRSSVSPVSLGGGASQTSINLTLGLGQKNTSSEGLGATMNLMSPGSSAVLKKVRADVNGQDGSGYFGIKISGRYTSTTAVNAFQITTTSGNITSGTARCYGLAK